MSAVSECGRSGAMLTALKHQQRKGQSWKWGRMMRRNGALGQAPLNSSIKPGAQHSRWMHFSSAEYVMLISALGGATLPVRFSFHWLHCPLEKHDTTLKYLYVIIVCIDWEFPAFWIEPGCMLCYFLFPDSSPTSPCYFRNVLLTLFRFYTLGVSLTDTHHSSLSHTYCTLPGTVYTLFIYTLNNHFKKTFLNNASQMVPNQVPVLCWSQHFILLQADVTGG